MAPTKELDATLTSNTNTSTINWDVGRGVFAAYGTFDGGTATLEASYDGGTTWFTVTSELATGSGDLTLTSNGAKGFFVPTGTLLRVTLSSATSPDLEVELMEMAEGDVTL